MPNLGGKNQKKKKKAQVEDREVRFKEESEEYAQIIKILGDGRFQCKCADGIERVAHVRGKMRKRIWLANGDIILVSLRDFENEKCDVVEKYKEKEVAKLKKAGEIPESMVLPSGSDNQDKGNIEDDIKFEDQEVVIVDKKKENTTGFEIDSESEEEDEKDEDEEQKVEKEEDKNDEDMEDDKEEEEKAKQEEIAREKEKKSKKEKKEKEKKRKNNRDKKRGDKEEDGGGFNIDDI